ncbi:uncharacterized protein LOC142989319 isoform X2 [Genypterus blacodes]|uniref:uncharacterized protein LOC142989319 isoform X2 n=1 Tax=Genypterus blacodes TaxID=154954 RepID=UPI003F764CE7
MHGHLFALLSLLCICVRGEVSLVKTVGTEPDVTPLCTMDTIRVVECKIETERSGGAVCHLSYGHPAEFVQGCDSRFTLKTENKTMVLSLRNLTHEDRGNITCQCSHKLGSDVVRLTLTVKDVEEASSSSPGVVATVIIVIAFIATAAVLGFLLRKKFHRILTFPHIWRQNTNSGASDLERSEHDDVYTSLQRPDSELYQTIASVQPRLHTETKPSCIDAQAVFWDDQETDGENDPDNQIYQNI